MSIGERIRYFRNKKGLSQKQLGIAAGFPENSADIRINQYESGSRTPKEALIHTLADIFEISPSALSVPDINSNVGIMHTFFTLEDTYGLSAEDVSINANLSKGMQAIDLYQRILEWKRISAYFKNGNISLNQYDEWRYNYPSVTLPSSTITEPNSSTPLNSPSYISKGALLSLISEIQKTHPKTEPFGLDATIFDTCSLILGLIEIQPITDIVYCKECKKCDNGFCKDKGSPCYGKQIYPDFGCLRGERKISDDRRYQKQQY